MLLPQSYAVAVREARQLIDFDDQTTVEQNAGAIVLVEDADEIAALVFEMLDELGYQVTRAANPAAALRAPANDRAVDLVFSMHVART